MAALAVAGHDPSVASASRPTKLLDDHQLPLSRAALLSHVQRFVNSSIHVLVPSYLDEDCFLEHLEEVLAAAPSPVGVASVPPMRRFNALMAAVIGIMMSAESAGLAYVAASLHGSAVRLLRLALHPSRTLDALHCICMLLVYSLFSPSGGSASDGPGHEDLAFSSVMDRPFRIQDSDIGIQSPPESDESSVPCTPAAGAKAAACRHLIRQAQVMSSLRDASGADPMFSYSNLCFWRDSGPPARGLRITTAEWHGCIEQLACRTIMRIVQPVYRAQRLAMPKSCWGALQTSRKTRQVRGTFLDMYDALSAAVILVCLTRRLGLAQDPLFLGQVLSSVHKASTVLTELSGRFHGLRSFRELIITLSARGRIQHRTL
ncbi:hypothetical protein GGTG_07147 [Gaeumannomyces tritici R3-111a-1]|uniref:Uncharacterized protein n=1 Tax=Gaeumannomyces tritici (strain R3-111a-1) TaxID=644352 RepID=J3P0V1_GAET3|nr:hypothetical protein GGTG_07147 [Gaeumannomyces tritici R3-111a-1]EJT77235.1 hypothetical protein GGTG_07147 [Gaeumannomyces tritici R3-111a-1]